MVFDSDINVIECKEFVMVLFCQFDDVIVVVL